MLVKRLLGLVALLILFSQPAIAERKVPIKGKPLGSTPHPWRHNPSRNTDKPITKINGEHKGLIKQANIVSNYIFRGISQTNNNPALQGGLIYFLPKTGMYISAWGSNVNLVDLRFETSLIELDTVIGITEHINQHANYDIRFSRYNYPGSSGDSYNELNFYYNYEWLTSQISYSNDIYASGRAGAYLNLGFNYLIPSKLFFNLSEVYLSGGYGYSALPNVDLHSYQDYSLAITKNIDKLILSLQWTDTDGNSTDLAAFKKAHVLILIGVSF